MDDNDAWWNCPAFPTKCLWDNFRDAPMDGFADALARAMLETVAGDPGDQGNNQQKTLGRRWLAACPKLAKKKTSAKWACAKIFLGSRVRQGP